MAKTKNKTTNKTIKNLVKTTKTTTFVRRTVAPNIEQIGPKAYRPRVTVNGVRRSVIVTSMTAANKWLKETIKNTLTNS